MQDAPRHREKPKPHRWLCNEHGVVEEYDFQYYKRSNPPPVDADPVLLRISDKKRAP